MNIYLKGATAESDVLNIFYFKVSDTIAQCKAEVAKYFGVEDSKYTLYRCDTMEEPAYALRRLK